MAKNLIEEYGLQRVTDSWRKVSQRLDFYEGFTDLVNLLDAAMETGRQMGRAESWHKFRTLRGWSVTNSSREAAA